MLCSLEVFQNDWNFWSRERKIWIWKQLSSRSSSPLPNGCITPSSLFESWIEMAKISMQHIHLGLWFLSLFKCKYRYILHKLPIHNHFQWKLHISVDLTKRGLVHWFYQLWHSHAPHCDNRWTACRLCCCVVCQHVWYYIFAFNVLSELVYEMVLMTKHLMDVEERIEKLREDHMHEISGRYTD